MPLYEYKCINPLCRTDKFVEVEAMSAPHEGWCPDCGEKADRVFSFGGFTIDFKPGYDHGLGEYVNTAKERDEIAARHGLRRKR